MASAKVAIGLLFAGSLLVNALLAKSRGIDTVELLARSALVRVDVAYLRSLVASEPGEIPLDMRRLVLSILIVEGANRGPLTRYVEGLAANSACRFGVFSERLGKVSLGVAQVQLRRIVALQGRAWASMSKADRRSIIAELLHDKTAVHALCRILQEENRRPVQEGKASIIARYHGDTWNDAAYPRVVSWLCGHMNERLEVVDSVRGGREPILCLPSRGPCLIPNTCFDPRHLPAAAPTAGPSS